MNRSLYALTVIITLLFIAKQTRAQTVDTLRGFDEIPLPELAYDSILVNDFEIYVGSTTRYTQSESAGWCAPVKNDQYISFIASPSGFGEVAFTITAFNCISNSGLEVGIYDVHNKLFGTCFESDQQVYQISNLTPGLVYYIRINGKNGDDCQFKLQFIGGIATSPPPPSVYIGNDTLCTAGCITAPTGEMITCQSIRYAFAASNDTIYYGQLFLDNFQELELEPPTYTFEEATCQYFIDLTWTGSTSPFYLNGQTYQNSFAQLGPFPEGDTVRVALSGSSNCVDTLFTEFSFFCPLNTVTVQSLGFEIIQTTSSLLQVSSPSYGWNLSLVDMLGRELISTPLQQDANQLYVGNLLQGTYFIVVQNGRKRATEKWVKR